LSNWQCTHAAHVHVMHWGGCEMPSGMHMRCYACEMPSGVNMDARVWKTKLRVHVREDGDQPENFVVCRSVVGQRERERMTSWLEWLLSSSGDSGTSIDTDSVDFWLIPDLVTDRRSSQMVAVLPGSRDLTHAAMRISTSDNAIPAMR